jgi:hypothetical protein
VGWQPLLALRCADQRRRVVLEHPLAPQIAAEAANRGQLACRGRARVAAPVQVPEKGADFQMIQIVGREIGAPAPRLLREECQELG